MDYEKEIELLRKKLEEARIENDQLRADLGRKKQQRGFPDEIVKNYPKLVARCGGTFVKQMMDGRTVEKYFLNEPLDTMISKIIRMTVFADTEQQSRTKNGRHIAVQDMNQEEYKLWIYVLESVLDALEYGIAWREEMLATTKGSV